MSSWSPPTRRVVDVVEFLVQRGEQRCPNRNGNPKETAGTGPDTHHSQNAEG